MNIASAIRAGLAVLFATALAGCASSPPPEGAPQGARDARARFDARCAERPSRAVMEQALAEISEPNAIRTVERRDFDRELPWQLRQIYPGTRNAVIGGGKPFGTRSVLGFGPSYVRAAVYLDGEDKVLGCRSDIFLQGP